VNIDLVPGRWWRVLDADGGLWMETSDEQEARDAMAHDAQAASLERLWVPHRDVGEWRVEVSR
jgi:hypothetical protein